MTKGDLFEKKSNFLRFLKSSYSEFPDPDSQKSIY